MDLLRSLAAHEVAIGGRSYQVAPPSVLHALTIIYSAVEASKGDQEALAELRDAARRWLPRRVYWHLFPPRWMQLLIPSRRISTRGSVELLTKIVSLGAPEPKDIVKKRRNPAEKPPTAEEMVERFLRTDWTLHTGEVAHAFNTPICDVLQLPWPLYYQLVEDAASMRARWQLDYMAAKSLQYIEEDFKREKAMDDLQKRAGYVEEKTREQILREQRETIERMRRAASRGRS